MTKYVAWCVFRSKAWNSLDASSGAFCNAVFTSVSNSLPVTIPAFLHEFAKANPPTARPRRTRRMPRFRHPRCLRRLLHLLSRCGSRGVHRKGEDSPTQMIAFWRYIVEYHPKFMRFPVNVGHVSFQCLNVTYIATTADPKETTCEALVSSLDLPKTPHFRTHHEAAPSEAPEAPLRRTLLALASDCFAQLAEAVEVPKSRRFGGYAQLSWCDNCFL